jgi:hypothetical protein
MTTRILKLVAVKSSKEKGMKKLLLVVALVISQNIFAETIFVLPTKIGDKVFNDVLVLNDTVPVFTKLTGSLTVPGVFTSPLINGRRSANWAGEQYQFSIIARENGTETKINYEFGYLHSGEPGMHGTLSLEDGTVIGEIHEAYELRKVK